MSEQGGAIEPSGARDAGPAKDEDLIESEPPSPRTSELRRRLEILVPATVGRHVLAAVAAAVLALGLVAGFLVGNQTPPNERTDSTEMQDGGTTEAGYIPIVPEGSPLEEEFVVLSVGAEFLTLDDLSALGETVLPGGYGLGVTSGLDGLCGVLSGPEVIRVPATPRGEFTVLNSASFVLPSAILTERISPHLDVLAASTLRGTVELARSCPHAGGLTLQTEGIQTGIGDEYAVFILSRPDPESGDIKTSIVILLRVGGRLVELTLSPEGVTEVPDGLTRALRIAEVAVTRMMTA